MAKPEKKLGKKEEKTLFDGDEFLQKALVNGLIRWNAEENDRAMPWKGEKDPYRIWLSEIILQQTRVEQGLAYYNRFITQYPTVRHLAEAPADEVYKLWEGLGYYSRCRNLILTAQRIAAEFGGRFPDRYETIRSLKGVGPYTAAAIASFAFNLPHAVLDGNVFRVLARVFALDVAVDTTEGKKLFTALADRLLPHDQPAAYNQAIMDFGAVICKPAPLCPACFLKEHCRAYRTGRQPELPVKSKKGKLTERWFHYAVLKAGGRYAIRQRTGRDVWQQLYEFPLLEGDRPLSEEEIQAGLDTVYGLKREAYTPAGLLSSGMQRLSHQKIHFFFYLLELEHMQEPGGVMWVAANELRRFAFPKTLQQFIMTEIQ